VSLALTGGLMSTDGSGKRLQNRVEPARPRFGRAPSVLPEQAALYRDHRHL